MAITVIRWGECIYGPFADYAAARAFIENRGRDAAEKRKAHITTMLTPVYVDDKES